MSFLQLLLSPSSIALILSTVAGILVALNVLNKQRKQYVALAIRVAFSAVNDLAAMRAKAGETTALDKAAEGLRVANEWMVAQGWAGLSEAEAQVAKINFQALNAESNASKK